MTSHFWSAQARVISLKKVIQSEREMGTLRGIDPHNLELWKPRDINAIVAKPADTLVERIESLGASLSEFAEKLEPSERLLNIFSTQPSEDHIQIVVTIKDPNKRRRTETPQTPVISYAASPEKGMLDIVISKTSAGEHNDSLPGSDFTAAWD